MQHYITDTEKAGRVLSAFKARSQIEVGQGLLGASWAGVVKESMVRPDSGHLKDLCTDKRA